MHHPKKKLDSLGARARKSFSQNFLSSPHWVEKLALAAAEDTEAQEIWEVGPGLGAITKAILKSAKAPLVLFEIDRKLAENLRQELPQNTLHEGDFLETDIAALAGNKRIALISNLPYGLSTPILFQLLENRRHFTRLVLTFQREVAERLRAKPRTPDYGGLSVMTQLYFEIRSLGIIPPGAFYPKPDVDSEALVLLPRADAPTDFEALRRVVKQAFLHRRKKLSSNLKGIVEKAAMEAFLKERGLTESARPEELSPTDFRELATTAGISPAA